MKVGFFPILWLAIKKNPTFRYNPTFAWHCRVSPEKSGSSGFTKIGVWNNPTFHPQKSGFSKVGQHIHVCSYWELSVLDS